ncbi:MAG: hypothetical protein ABJ013_14980 [Halioglobus sp.]
MSTSTAFERAFSIGLAVVLVLLAWFAFKAIQHDLIFDELEAEVSFWGRGSYQPTESTRHSIASRLEKQLQINPKLTRLRALEASRLAWEGYWSSTDRDYKQFSRLAIEAQYASLATRPAYGQGWSKLLQYQAADELGEELHEVARVQLQKLKRWQ